MSERILTLVVILALPIGMATSVQADNQWQGGAGVPLNIWDEPTNWLDDPNSLDPGVVPNSSTEQHVDPNALDGLNNVKMRIDGTDTLIEDGVNALAFRLELGHPINGGVGVLLNQSASNTLTMTGGTLSQEGGCCFNVGRGTNILPGHLVQFNMSGGVVNAAGITVPEAFGPVAGSLGLNAEMHVSGDSVINTALLRLGAADSNSTVTLSDDAFVKLVPSTGGFSPGVLWIEAFEDPNNVAGTSLLEISDNAQLRVFGEWWTDGNGNGQRDLLTEEEYDYFVDEYVSRGWIAAGAGDTLFHKFVPTGTSDVFDPNGVPTGATVPTGFAIFSAVPEPTSAAIVMMAAGTCLVFRRKSLEA